jgi:hypothetical protein
MSSSRLRLFMPKIEHHKLHNYVAQLVQQKEEKKRTMEYHESVREKEATLAAKYSMASFYMGEEKLN